MLSQKILKKHKHCMSLRERSIQHDVQLFTEEVLDPLEQDTLVYLEQFNTILEDTQAVLRSFDPSCPNLWFTRLFTVRETVKQFNQRRESDKNLCMNLSQKKINKLIFTPFTVTFKLLTNIIKECTAVIKQLQSSSATTSSQSQSSIGAPILQVLTPLQTVYSLTSQILKAIKVMVRNNSTICHVLSNSDLFIDDLLLLMMWSGCEGQREEKIFKNSIVVIEGILVSKNFAFNAKLLNNLTTFMESVRHKELSHFLRILALLVLEVNDKQLFKVLEPKSGMTCSANHIVMNHALLVNQPDFLKKMHEIAVNIVEVIACLMDCRQESQIRERVEAVSKSGVLENSGICIQELLRIFVATESSARYMNLLNRKFIVEYCLKNSSLMELLFILQNLLTGRKKIVVQNVLTGSKFVENVLTPLFDILFHRDFNVDEVVSEEEEDSQDICFTARIQLLRLIINFSDRDEDNTLSKASFISPSEHFVLQNIEIPLILYLHSSSQGIFDSPNNPNEIPNLGVTNIPLEPVSPTQKRLVNKAPISRGSPGSSGETSTSQQSIDSHPYEYFNKPSSSQRNINPIGITISSQKSLDVSEKDLLSQLESCQNQMIQRAVSASPTKKSQFSQQVAQAQSPLLITGNSNSSSSSFLLPKITSLDPHSFSTPSYPQPPPNHSSYLKSTNEPIDGISKYKQLVESCQDSPVENEGFYHKIITNTQIESEFQQLLFPEVCNKLTTLAYRKNRLEFVSEKGLMHKIIDTLKKVDDNCQLRFWLGSCVEAFLRGAHWYLQLFVFETGLLYFLTRQYVLNNLQKVNNIQVTLDVLAELVKFNTLGVMYLNILLAGEDWMKKVEKIMFKNIVDTNVFLRNLQLTYFKVDYLKKLNHQSNPSSSIHKKRKNFIQNQEKHNILFKILCEVNLLRNLRELFECVHEDNMNIDNISCINSALVIFIFYYSNGTFTQAMNTLAQQTTTFLRFQRVLNLWLYYLQLKTREIYSLTFSTSFNFHYFNQAIQLFNEFIAQNTPMLLNNTNSSQQQISNEISLK